MPAELLPAQAGNGKQESTPPVIPAEAGNQ